MIKQKLGTKVSDPSPSPATVNRGLVVTHASQGLFPLPRASPSQALKFGVCPPQAW